MSEPIRIGRIYIVESLPLDEGFASRTGRYLFDVLEPQGLGCRPEVDVKYAQVNTKADLFRLLDAIGDRLKADHLSPLLHIEAHGEMRRPNELTSRGIVTGSNELITWSELAPALAEINSISRMNLLVFMATCFGCDLATVIRPTSRAPARLVIGPPEGISPASIQAATEAFYMEFFRTFDGNAAVRAMNQRIAPASMWAIEASWLFKQIMAGYFATLGTESSIRDRVSRILLDVPAPARTDQLRRSVESQVGNNRRVFEVAYREFFSIDQYPENAARFPVEFSDCSPTAPTPS